MSICPGSAGKHTHKRLLFSIVCESGLLFRRCCVVRTLCTIGGIVSEDPPPKKRGGSGEKERESSGK